MSKVFRPALFLTAVAAALWIAYALYLPSFTLFPQQLEHLVNLDLLEANLSYKVASNDHLVNLGGQYRGQTTPSGQLRFRYLQLLIKGKSLLKQREIVVNRLKVNEEESAAALEQLQTLREKIEDLEERKDPVLNRKLIDAFAALGISDWELKETIDQLKDQLVDLSQLRTIAKRIGDDHSLLRSKRGILLATAELEKVEQALSTHALQIAHAERSLADVSWYFADRICSTKGISSFANSEEFTCWYEEGKKCWNEFPKRCGQRFYIPDQLRNSLIENAFRSDPPLPYAASLFVNYLPILGVLFLLAIFLSRQLRQMGQSTFQFGRSPAKLTSGDSGITFADVAGCAEAKEELQEIVDFLKDPAPFIKLGARIPRGILCAGPPGTGKTLLARAVAGEAKRPFFNISGSDFVEMFVGVGASRIRDLFAKARQKAPCIVFIDEIDAIGRQRGTTSHEEREQTLNQLLVELDGFDQREGIILIAATNRPEVLDKALLRPGRFDRQVFLDLPALEERNQILEVHARRLPLDEKINLAELARATSGASGADLANILNEGALLAARRQLSKITSAEIAIARDKVFFGRERKYLLLDDSEKKTTAYHEAGHVLIAWTLPHADPIDKVSIIPRRQSLGATYFLPLRDKHLHRREELLDRLSVLLGGRAAEELFLTDISNGAQMDLDQATHLVRKMVCEWGMASTLISYREGYSEATAAQIDRQVQTLLSDAYARTCRILEKMGTQLESIATALLSRETLDYQDLKALLSPAG